MRNYLLLQNVENVPYRLIKKVLVKCKRDHLCKLESSNVLLIFEDDELWLHFLKQDFPTSVHDCFVSKKDNIKDYYIDFIKKYDSELLKNERERVDTYLENAIRKDPTTKKYKMPYRLLYFRYQQDVEKKQEKSAERLRYQMKKLEMERQKNQPVVVDHSFYAQNQPKRASKNLARRSHSDLFRKSIKDHENRVQHFRSGGFDITKRHTTRVAFSGSVPNISESTAIVSPTKASEERGTIMNQPTPPPPASQNSQSPPKLKKRRSEPPSIFLNRKRPTLQANRDKIIKAEGPNSKPKKVHIENGSAKVKVPVVTSGHKKKSALFSSPAILDKETTPPATGRNKRTSIYIFEVQKP